MIEPTTRMPELKNAVRMAHHARLRHPGERPGAHEARQGRRGEGHRIGVQRRLEGPTVDQLAGRQRADACDAGRPEQAFGEEGAQPVAGQELVQPGVERAGAHRAERGYAELHRDEQVQAVGLVGHPGQEGHRQDEHARRRDGHDGDLAALLQPLDERDGGQLQRLSHQWNGGQQADLHGPGAQREGEAHQNNPALQLSLIHI